MKIENILNMPLNTQGVKKQLEPNNINQDSLKKIVEVGLIQKVFENSFKSNSSFSMILQSIMSSMLEKNGDQLGEKLNSSLTGVKLQDLANGFSDTISTLDLKNTYKSYNNKNYGINTYLNGSVKGMEKISVKNPRIMQAVDLACRKYNMDKNLVLSVIKQESDFNPNCKSWAGAMGLMQLMPENCTDYGVSNPYNIEQNVDAGVRHLKDMIRGQKGNIALGLAAYNAGPGTLHRRGVTSVDGIVNLPSETRNYVKKVLGYCKTL